MRRTCVIDTSTLVSLTILYEFSLLDKLRNLFERIHVPLTVRAEYEQLDDPIRKRIISGMRLNTGFLSLCSIYDTITHAILRTTPGIDAGEADAAAQHKKVESHFVLSDDERFIKAITLIDRTIKILSTLDLIAWLDLSNYLPEGERTVMLMQFHSRRRFHSRQLRRSYQRMAGEFGLQLSKNQLNEKSSLKHLGLFGR
jgi:predicted nucleic acid-binding protein